MRSGFAPGEHTSDVRGREDSDGTLQLGLDDHQVRDAASQHQFSGFPKWHARLDPDDGLFGEGARKLIRALA